MYNLIICNMNYKKSYSVINYSLNKKARTPSNVDSFALYISSKCVFIKVRQLSYNLCLKIRLN